MVSYTSFLHQIAKAAREGLHPCYRETDEFLLDACAGELPWNRDLMDAAVNAMQADPAWPVARDGFKARFGVDLDAMFAEDRATR